MEMELDKMFATQRRRDRRSREGGGGYRRERRGDSSRVKGSRGRRYGTRNFKEPRRGKRQRDHYDYPDYSYGRYYQPVPYNSSQMMNFVPVPVSVPFPTAAFGAIGGGYSQLRRDYRDVDYSRGMMMGRSRRRSDHQTRNYRPDYLQRVSSSNRGRKSNSRREHHSSSKRRDRRSGGGGANSSRRRDKKMTVDEMDMELDTYMHESRHPRIPWGRSLPGQ